MILSDHDRVVDTDALLSRVAAGDRTAFRVLVRLHAPLLVGYASRILRSRDVAEEVVQEVLCRIWDQRETLIGCDSIRAYLLGAVRNTALNTLRRLQAEERWALAYGLEDRPPGMGLPSPDLDDTLIRAELARALQDAIDQLPERRRQILVLRLQQLSYGEIAKILGISPKTVEAQITQAFATLRTALGPWME